MGSRGRAARSIRTRPTHYPSPDAARRHRIGRFAARAADRADHVRASPRPERRPRARHPPDVRDRARAVPARARRAIGARFLGRAAARARPAAADGRVLAEPLPARVALPPRAGRRVPGHEPRAVGAGLAAGQAWGEGARPRRRAVDLHRRRPQAVDLSLPRRRGRGAAGGRALHRGAAAAGSPRRSITRSFRAVPELLAFVNDVFAEMSQPRRRAPTSSRTAKADRFPVDPSRDAGARTGARHRGGRRPGGLRGRGGRRDRADPARGQRPRPADRRAARRPRPATSPSCSARARATASSSTSSNGCGIPTYVYKGLGFFDADEIKDVVGAASLSGRPDLGSAGGGVPALAFRPAVRRGLAALAPRPRAGAHRSPAPAGRVAALDDEDRRVLDTRARTCRGWLAQVDRVPPADSIEQILRETAYAYELRGPRRRRPGRTSRRCAA